MGLLFAARCSICEGEIYLITHSSEQSNLLRQNDIWLFEDDRSLKAHLNVLPFDTVSKDDLEINLGLRLDWIFLFVKQQHINEQLIQYLSYWSNRGTPILCFQNGIGHIERLSQSMPIEHIYTAVTTEAALRESPYQVKHTGKGETWIGHESPQYSLCTTKENKLMNYLRNAGFTVNSSKNIKSIVWKKLLINAVINPLTAILKVRNGELIASPHWKQLMSSLYNEGRAVAESLGIDLSEQSWEQLIDVCKATSMNTSSMLQDTLDTKITEVEWINGAIIRIAEQRQLQVPTHQAIYQMMKGIEPSSSFSYEN